VSRHPPENTSFDICSSRLRVVAKHLLAAGFLPHTEHAWRLVTRGVPFDAVCNRRAKA